MTKYDVIYEGLCDRVDCGELTFEEAEYLNDIAYELYNEETITEEDKDFNTAGIDWRSILTSNSALEYNRGKSPFNQISPLKFKLLKKMAKRERENSLNPRKKHGIVFT